MGENVQDTVNHVAQKKTDLSSIKENQMEPNNRLSDTAENAYNIGLTVTKRCSYEGVANSSLVHKNLPRPPHGTGVTGHTKVLKQQDRSRREKKT